MFGKRSLFTDALYPACRFKLLCSNKNGLRLYKSLTVGHAGHVTYVMLLCLLPVF